MDVGDHGAAELNLNEKSAAVQLNLWHIGELTKKADKAVRLKSGTYVERKTS